MYNIEDRSGKSILTKLTENSDAYCFATSVNETTNKFWLSRLRIYGWKMHKIQKKKKWLNLMNCYLIQQNVFNKLKLCAKFQISILNHSIENKITKSTGSYKPLPRRALCSDGPLNHCQNESKLTIFSR